MGRKSKYSRGLREMAVRRVLETEREHDSQWVTIQSVALEIGCTAATLRKWVRDVELVADEEIEQTKNARLRAQNREGRHREFERANAILRQVVTLLSPADLVEPAE